MTTYTEAEARKKTAFRDCGEPFHDSYIHVIDSGGRAEYEIAKSRLAYETTPRRCIASDCIAWVWDTPETERFKRGDQYSESGWTAYSPGAAYKKEDVDKPEGNVGWCRFAPYMKDDERGWWERQNQARRGGCGRVNMNVNVTVEHG